MTQAPFHIHHPDELKTCVVFASPHSGRAYSPEFLRSSRLDPHELRRSEDAFVDQLFDNAANLGAPVLVANTPRAFVDFNRSSNDLDPALIRGARTVGINPRVIAGLGVIPRIVWLKMAIYNGKLSFAEAHKRLSEHWHPYHAALTELMDVAHEKFGQVILIDCHSMPHVAVDPDGTSGRRAPQIVLGDRFGASARGDIVDNVESMISQAGFRVSRNSPFAGAYIAQHYGRPAQNRHVIQIEIDRSLYMDERRITPRPDFGQFRMRLHGLIADIVQLGTERRRLAAE